MVKKMIFSDQRKKETINASNKMSIKICGAILYDDIQSKGLVAYQSQNTIKTFNRTYV